ncbi:MAG: DHA2 family efflux MFS transporter permease subunit [Candidatus Dormibacteraceae bacterium]
MVVDNVVHSKRGLMMAEQSTAETRQLHDSPRGAQPLDRQLKLLAGVVILGAVMTVLDATAVNVALHTLVIDLHTTLSAAQWVFTGYLLTLALVVPVTAWATDRFGAKRLWMFSLGVFTLGSVLSGLSWSIGALIVFRLLQGLGGGMIAPLAQSILARAAGPRRMGRVMSILGVVTVLGPVLGPLLGGVLVQDTSWRWIFFINIPIGGLALLGAARVLPVLPCRPSKRLDWPGMVLISLGLVGVVYGLSRVGGHSGFAAPEVYGPVIAGVGFLAVFTLYSWRRGRMALIDVRLFSNRGFAAASAALFLIGMALFGVLLLLPLYYQSVRGQGALGAGLLLIPQGIGVAVALPLAGKLTDRFGARVVVIPGLILMLLGTLAYTQVTAHTSYLVLSGALVVRGLGMGLVMTPVTAAAYVRLPAEKLAQASSVTTVIRQIGGSVGTALLAVILADNLLHTAPAHAFGRTFWVAFALTSVVLLPALFLVRAPRSRKPDVPMLERFEPPLLPG